MFEDGWLPLDLLAEFADHQTDAYRIFSHESAWIERFGNDVLISGRDLRELAELQAGLRKWSGFSIHRIFTRMLVHAPGSLNIPVQVSGPANESLRLTVREAGTIYEVDLGAGYSTGLFLDQRENRTRLQRLNPKRLLNLFAYTCSFSVRAALVGADTLSVDLARKALDWGRRNFILNGLDPSMHGFVAADVMEYLPRLVKRGEMFDVIVIDPPTFARGERGRVFQVEKAMRPLAESALQLVTSGGAILLSTNCRNLSPFDLKHLAQQAADNVGKCIRTEAPPPPVDFGGGLPASTLWVFVE